MDVHNVRLVREIRGTSVNGIMNKIILTILFGFIGTFTVSIGQTFDSRNAGIGYIITYSDSLAGKVMVNMKSNHILLQQDGIYRQYEADQILKVVSVDIAGRSKVYYTGYFGLNEERYLFEAVVDGETPLLYREGLSFESYEESVSQEYFTLVNGSVTQLGKKKEILSLFSSNYDQLAYFLKENNLKLRTAEELKTFFLVANHNSASPNTLMAGED